MGMFTEIYVNVNLVKELPDDVLHTLQAMCAYDAYSPHLSDKPDRWFFLFSNDSYMFPATRSAQLTYQDSLECYSLLGKGDIKNYQGEIEAFFAWLMPYIDAEEGSFIGYSLYEEDVAPTLIWKQSNKQET